MSVIVFGSGLLEELGHTLLFVQLGLCLDRLTGRQGGVLGSLADGGVLWCGLVCGYDVMKG